MRRQLEYSDKNYHTFIVIASALLFMMEIIEPWGFVINTLYLIIILLAFRSTDNRFPIIISILCTFFIMIDFIYHDYITSKEAIIINRLTPILVIWLITFLLGQKRRTEIVNRKNEHKYHLILENSMDAILLTAPDGSIWDANIAACEMFKMTREEICAAGRKGIIDSSDPNLKNLLEERRLKGKIRGELTGIKKDGTRFPIEFSSALYYDTDGNERTSIIMKDITERRKSEEELFRTKEILQKTFDALDQAIFIVDAKERTIITANIAMERIFGYKKEEVINRSTEFLHINKEWYDEFGRNLYKELDVNGVFRTEFKVRSKNGDILISDHVVTQAIDEKGERILLISAVRDITKQKMTEEKLKESAKNLKLFIDNTKNIIWAIDKEYRIMLGNKIFYNRIEQGVGHKVNVGDNGLELLPLSIKEDWREYYKRGLKGESFSVQTDTVKPLDKRIMTYSFSPIKNEEDETVGVSILGNDITELIKTREELSEREEMFYKAFNSNAAAMAIATKEGKYINVNKTMCDLLGYEQEELFGKTSLELGITIPTDHMNRLEKINRTDTVISYETDVLTRDGKKITFLSFVDKIRIKGIEHYLATNVDITELKQAKKDFKNLIERLNESEESMRKNISRQLHDEVGQNLTALNIHLNYLDTEFEKISKTAIKRRLEDSINILDEIIVQIRDIMTELRPSVLDDYGLNAAIKWKLNKISKRGGINYEYHGMDLSKRLPIKTEYTIFKVIQEALHNIEKHSKAKNIRVDMIESEDKIMIEISDDGVGFSISEKRENKSDEEYGLGLFDMNERINYIGGELHIVSGKGKGTNIILEINKKSDD